jgi:hypothetical protein
MARRTCRLTCQSHGLVIRTGGQTATRSGPARCTEVRPHPGRREADLVRAGARRGKRPSGRVRQQPISGKETTAIKPAWSLPTWRPERRPHCSSSRHFAFRRRENRAGDKKRLKTRFMSCQRFAAAAGPGAHVHTAMPSSCARAARGTVQKTDRSPRRSWCRRRRPA